MDPISVGRQGMLDLLAEGAPLEQILSNLCVLVEKEALGSFCSVLILDQDGKHLRHGAAPNLPESYCWLVDGLVIGPNAGSCGSAAYFGQEVVVEDINTDPRWVPWRDLGLLHHLAACVSIPIMGPSAKVLGTFALYHTKPGPFSESELTLLRSIMGLASLAIRIHQQEISLRSSEFRLRFMVEALPDMYLRIRGDGTILDFHHGAYPSALDGLQVVGSRIQDAPLPPERRPALFEAVTETLRTGKMSTLECYFNLPDGEHYREVQFVPSSSDEILALVRDITERKRTEDALRESESNFRTFFRSVDDLNFVSNLTGEIIHTNPAVTRALGYSPEELKGMHIIDLHPSEKRHEAEAILPAIFSGELNHCSLSLQSKSGSIVPTDIHVWRGKWNGTDCLYEICREQEPLQLFSRLFNSNPCLMAIIEMTEQRFVDVNEALLNTLGYSRDAVVGKTTMDLGLIVEAEVNQGFSDELQRHGRIVNREEKVRCKDGSILDCLISGEVIESQARRYFITTMIDQTETNKAAEERRKIDARLMQAQKAESLGILAGGIAHDFNNLAAGIMGCAELAELSLPKESPIRCHLNNIIKSVKKASEFTSQMLAYSGQRIFGNQGVAAIDLSREIRFIESLLRSLCPPSVSLAFDLASNLPPFTTDASQMKQVVINLVLNAGEALPKGLGEIRIRTRAVLCEPEDLASLWILEDYRAGTYVELTVQDNGSGIAPENLPRIFDPFFSTKFIGRGLGLAAVLGIVRAQHGSIQVISSIGQGSCFKILWPADEHDWGHKKQNN